jgi:lipopolysaccharide transport system ATP-binding protein
VTLALSIEDISKRYRLGTYGTGSATEDIRNWWSQKILRRPITPTKVFDIDHGNRDGKNLWALRGVSFDVKEGEVVGIIGKNGSGKSTLLKVLSQITAPTMGRIKVNGRLASLLEVGTGFHGELTGRENIYLNGSILGMTPAEIRRRFDEIVDFSEIGQFLDTPVKRYSSGMFVRLAFAVAAHLETEILVVDEVLAVGDVGFQRKCLGKMADASTSGRTVLFVSHRMDHVSALCSRCIVLDRGRLTFDGSANAGVQEYYGLFEKQAETEVNRRIEPSWLGRVRIVGVTVEDEVGRPIQFVASGARVRFVVNLENTTPEKISNLKVSLFLYSADGTHIADLGIWESGAEPFEIDRSASVVIDVSRLPLNRGGYRLSAVVRSARGAYEIDDLIENVGTFDVDYGDFHGIGSAVGGLISIDHKTSIENVKELLL